jgi:SAM-dependent methyltransferase
MRRTLVPLLRCPADGTPLELAEAVGSGVEVEMGTLRSASGASYPIVRGIPRFVPATNYADSFGLQWNRFRRTQLDSHSGQPISRDRFYRFTAWRAEELRDARVLDVGCGAGRFTEVALAAGAHVVALDYSGSVDACRANHVSAPRLDVVQGDVYSLPFVPGSFDFVYCLGVLQHTPDVERAVLALPPMLPPGGRLAVDVYPRLWRNLLWPKYWLRPLTRRLPAERLFRLVTRAVPVLLPVSRALGRLPGVGRQLCRAIPVANYEGVLPLTPSQVQEWAVLDTFDMLAPAYDQPQDAETLRAWFVKAGMIDVWVERLGFVVGRGTRL